MDPELIVPLISRWAHIGSAILLVGGTAFMFLAVIPSLDADSSAVGDRIRANWKKFVHIGILVFLVSGFYNYIAVTIPQHKGDGLYHALVGTKIILAFGVFFIASALVGNKPGTQKFRDDSKKWTGVALLLAGIIVAISGFAKVRGIPEKAQTEMADADSANAD